MNIKKQLNRTIYYGTAVMMILMVLATLVITYTLLNAWSHVELVMPLWILTSIQVARISEIYFKAKEELEWY